MFVYIVYLIEKLSQMHSSIVYLGGVSTPYVYIFYVAVLVVQLVHVAYFVFCFDWKSKITVVTNSINLPAQKSNDL